MCPSRFHLPILLRSTVVTRFVATMRTLTPDPLLPAPGQVSLVHARALPDIPSPPTPCASAPAMLPAPGRLGPRFACPAIGGSSDFAHCSQSRQSHMAVSSLCCGSSLARQFYGLSVHFRLLSTSRCRDAVTFSCLAGSTAREGLPPSGARWLPSARVPAKAGGPVTFSTSLKHFTAIKITASAAAKAGTPYARVTSARASRFRAPPSPASKPGPSDGTGANGWGVARARP